MLGILALITYPLIVITEVLERLGVSWDCFHATYGAGKCLFLPDTNLYKVVVGQEGSCPLILSEVPRPVQVVAEEGVEPSQDYSYTHLKRARLPVPPFGPQLYGVHISVCPAACRRLCYKVPLLGSITNLQLVVGLKISVGRRVCQFHFMCIISTLNYYPRRGPVIRAKRFQVYQ